MTFSRAAGFTLIELLIVIGIIGVLAATLLPDLNGNREGACLLADARNLSQQYMWLEMARSPTKLGHLPSEGGHMFLLTLWTRDAIDHSVENFDRFFTPGSDDPYYHELRKKVERNENPWPDLRLTTSQDTHYAARAKDSIASMRDFKEAWAADDNESGWTFPSACAVNILWGNGSVRPLTLSEMKEQYGLVDKDTEVFKTYGKDSRHPALQKLEN